MNNPQVVWCNRTDCFYCERDHCSKYNITINIDGCSSYSNGKRETRYHMGTKEEIYKRDEIRAWDEYADAMR